MAVRPADAAGLDPHHKIKRTSHRPVDRHSLHLMKVKQA
jgi:hypothetical protein